MGANDEEGVWVGADEVQDLIQPGKHVFKNGVGVNLAGVEDDIGEDGHEADSSIRLAVGGDFGEQGFVEALHFGPELQASHGEVALKAILQIGIEAGVLGGGKLKIVGDVDGVGGDLPVGEVGGEGLMGDFVGDDAQAALLGHPAGGGFGVGNAIEDDEALGVGFVEEGGELLGEVVGGADEGAEQGASGFVIGEGVDAESPAEGGEGQFSEGNVGRIGNPTFWEFGRTQRELERTHLRHAQPV